jgi:hypothetical protein
MHFDTLTLDTERSNQIFKRTGEVEQIVVFLKEK